MTATATSSPATRALTVALIGNPNTGKSTLFNALSGGRVRTGNYPGVTVEKKTGKAEFHGRQFKLIDLPGTYSLAPRSPDEMVAVDVLLGRQSQESRPDVVLCIVDASNLERNFYLLSQVLELGLPTVVAVNMMDLAEERGLKIQLDKLRAQVPVEFIPVQAHRGKGLNELKQALSTAADKPPAKIASPFPDAFKTEVTKLEQLAGEGALPRYLAERLLLDTSGYLAGAHLAGVTPPVIDALPAARERLAKAGAPVPAIEAMARYQWAANVLKPAVTRPTKRPDNFSDRVDRLLTHWFFGTAFFLLVMFLLFQAVSWIAGPSGDIIDGLIGIASDWVSSVLAEGPLQSLINNGILAGVGGVIVFVPQIMLLFFFIAILEDCGYMARAAYLMDKLMVRVGLSGKSFIPLLSSFACAIPGMMAARVIENRRDRLVTILVAPLMSCSARLPVYVLLTQAFIPEQSYLGGLISLQGLVMFAMYSIGAIVGIGMAWLLKLTILRGPTPPFVLELPTYKWPGLWIVLHRMFEQGWAFIYRAGTLILAVSVVVWALAYYPRTKTEPIRVASEREAVLASEVATLEKTVVLPEEEASADSKPAEKPPLTPEQQQLVDKKAELDDVRNHIAATHLENSYLGQMGKVIEPAVRPLGWDWKLGSAAIASFPAREVIVATLGTIYGLGDSQEAESKPLQERLQAATWSGSKKPVYTIPVALSVMVFFALCAQCASTLAIMKRETGSYWWPVFTFVYMTTLAYIGAFIAYQLGTWLGW
ncbi:Ferrous iron transport protein B [Anatilimnocola aggregata]|uniref:Ferrous iron transport protein B n=1 Tax=Anatilimnocola aggregata TaxID=2528021 RepID=A0A517YLK6_9BACT|nr:ferrous iron transport protein B [Anatilimnocola aggregata]QDU31115.1 Ferrous iron transport protein B [Anatilimnocola aggregata]